VGNFCRQPRLMQHLLLGCEGKTDRTHPHSSAVAPAVVGLGGIGLQPAAEGPTVAGTGIAAAHPPDCIDIRATREDGISHRHSEHRVIREG
jgi:hypothetical protein